MSIKDIGTSLSSGKGHDSTCRIKFQKLMSACKGQKMKRMEDRSEFG